MSDIGWQVAQAAAWLGSVKARPTGLPPDPGSETPPKPRRSKKMDKAFGIVRQATAREIWRHPLALDGVTPVVAKKKKPLGTVALRFPKPRKTPPPGSGTGFVYDPHPGYVPGVAGPGLGGL